MLNAPAQRPSQTAIRRVGTLPVTSFAAGANVKVVQQMLGHATASMTLDLYGHLFPDQLDDVADRLDVIGRAAAKVSADFLRTKGPLTPLKARAVTR